MPNLEHVTWRDPTVTPSRLAISSRLIPSATNSLIFSITCGVNFMRLPLMDELAFVIVMAVSPSVRYVAATNVSRTRARLSVTNVTSLVFIFFISDIRPSSPTPASLGGRHRAQGLALSLGAFPGLGQDEEPRRARGKAGGGGGSDTVIDDQ